MSLFGRHSEPYEFNDLANYNSEVARGIVHTPEWDERMRAEQERFVAEQLSHARLNGWVIVGPGGQVQS